METHRQQKWMNAKLSVERCLEKALFADEIAHYVEDKDHSHTTDGLRALIEALKEDLEFAVANLNEMDKDSSKAA